MDGSLPPQEHPGQPAVDPDLNDVSRFVHEEFDNQLDPHAIDETLGHVAARFDNARIRSFVPLLVRRYTREELQTRLRQGQIGLGPQPGREAVP